MAAPLPKSTHNSSHIIINLPTNPEPRKNTTRCIRSALTEQLFTGPELAKLLLTLDFGGILATPVISHNHFLPEYYLPAISVLLFIGFFALLSATALHKTFPNTAETLGLIGAACVVSVIPVITAGVLPKLGFLVWVFFVLLLLIAVLSIVLVHMAIPEERYNSDAVSEVGALATEAGLGSEDVKVRWANKSGDPVSDDDAGEVELGNSDVACDVRGVNPSLREMRGFFRRVWGRYGVDEVFKVREGGFVVRFREHGKALKVVEGRGVTFDGRPVITKLCGPNVIDLNKDQFRATVPVRIQHPGLGSENCKRFGHRVATKKMWVPKTSCGSVGADKGKAICVGN